MSNAAWVPRLAFMAFIVTMCTDNDSSHMSAAMFLTAKLYYFSTVCIVRLWLIVYMEYTHFMSDT